MEIYMPSFRKAYSNLNKNMFLLMASKSKNQGKEGRGEERRGGDGGAANSVGNALNALNFPAANKQIA